MPGNDGSAMGLCGEPALPDFYQALIHYPSWPEPGLLERCRLWLAWRFKGAPSPSVLRRIHDNLFHLSSSVRRNGPPRHMELLHLNCRAGSRDEVVESFSCLQWLNHDLARAYAPVYLVVHAMAYREEKWATALLAENYSAQQIMQAIEYARRPNGPPFHSLYLRLRETRMRRRIAPMLIDRASSDGGLMLIEEVQHHPDPVAWLSDLLEDGLQPDCLGAGIAVGAVTGIHHTTAQAAIHIVQAALGLIHPGVDAWLLPMLESVITLVEAKRRQGIAIIEPDFLAAAREARGTLHHRRLLRGATPSVAVMAAP